MSDDGDWVDFKSENEDESPFPSETKSNGKRQVRFSAGTFNNKEAKPQKQPQLNKIVQQFDSRNQV